MKKIFVVFLSLSIVALFSVLAAAWSMGNSWRRQHGSTAKGLRATQNAWGGSSSHTAGEGSSHTNA